MSLLTPQTAAPARPGLRELSEISRDRPDADLGEAAENVRGRILYLRSYLVMRTAIGILGLGLPLILLVGDWFFLMGTPRARGSLSGYYYSGMRDVFVGASCATAIFLITYKVVERTLDNTLSILAGVAVLGVALFPTKPPGGSEGPLTPLQESLGETTVATVHSACAAIFVLSLAVISYFFGVREGKRSQTRDGRRATMSPTFWRRFHKLSALAIALAVLFVVVTKLFSWFQNYSLLAGETVAVVAFGLSWLTKGLELDMLLTPTSPAPQAQPALGTQGS